MERLAEIDCEIWSHMNFDVMANFLLPNDREVENMEQVVKEIEENGCACC